MTPPLSPDRAAEIIAAYGADPARWPAAERATALAVIAASVELRAAQAAAAALDADLVAWAQTPVDGGDAAAAAAVALRRPRPFLRWAGGAGIAAAVAAGLLAVAPAHRGASTHLPTAAAVAPAVTADDATAFAQVFTPTPDEEQTL